MENERKLPCEIEGPMNCETKDLTAPEDVEKVNRGEIAEWEKLNKTSSNPTC